jgi:hypothetical protein
MTCLLFYLELNNFGLLSRGIDSELCVGLYLALRLEVNISGGSLVSAHSLGT